MTSIIDAPGSKKVWFLTGSQALYGDETLRQVAEQSEDVARQLAAGGGIPVAVEWRPVLTTRDAIRTAMLEANAADDVVGVIVWMHTFSPAKMWIAGLEALAKPMLHLHTQHGERLPFETIDFDFMNLNQAAHGDREFGYIAARLGAPRTIVVGHASHDRVRSQVETWARAALGTAAVRSLRLARFGDNMRFVAVTEGDKTEAEIRLGVQVNTWGVTELADAVAAADEQAVAALIDEYVATYDVADELLPGGVRHASLIDGARIEVGLRSFLEEGGFHAFTTSFEDLGTLPQLPGLAVQRLMADGYGFGAEGDWKTAVLVHAAAAMGTGLPGGASLMEDYTYHLVDGEELILGAHMLEVSPSITDERPRLEVHQLGIGGKDDPVRLVFTAKAGPGVVVALSDMRERFRMVANVIETVELPEAMPDLPVGHAVWRPEPSLATSAAAWLTAGAAHHTVLTNQLGIEVLREFARQSGIELLEIDARTELPSFEREVRLNAAYHRLAQGL